MPAAFNRRTRSRTPPRISLHFASLMRGRSSKPAYGLSHDGDIVVGVLVRDNPPNMLPTSAQYLGAIR